MAKINPYGRHSDAIFSEDRKHRYVLYRIWDHHKPIVQFIGLNPSTANESTDDPTIKSIKRIAANNGFGGIYMTNLFSYITAYPEELFRIGTGNAIGADNDSWLIQAATEASCTVFAWGNFKVNGREKSIIEKFPRAKVLGLNKNGSPKHPLYIKSDTQFINYKTNP